jgi:hypothetical protein
MLNDKPLRPEPTTFKGATPGRDSYQCKMAVLSDNVRKDFGCNRSIGRKILF